MIILWVCSSRTQVLVARFDDVPYEVYLKLTERLRDAGICASLYLGQKKFGKQLEYAVKTDCTHLLVLGGDEYARGVVKIKDLAAREEREVPLKDIEKAFD